MDPFKVTVEIEVSGQDVDDILCAAFEGGITYWCDSVKVAGPYPKGTTYASECLSRGSDLVLHDAEPNDAHVTDYVLTLEKFKKGMSTYIMKNGWSGDVGDIDAPAADEIVQYALFDELVFG